MRAGTRIGLAPEAIDQGRQLAANLPIVVMRFFSRRLVRWGIILVIGGVILFICRRPVLSAAASWWIVNDSPRPAAAILVLGGSPDTRPFAAARLFKEGHAPRILLTKVKPAETERLGLRPNDADLAREVLIHEGVPPDAIEFIGTDVTSTFDETGALFKWFQEQPAGNPRHILIPTDSFCTRRTRWIFNKQLEGTATASVIQIPSASYSPDNWWQHEQGLIDFQNEVIKHCYYRCKY